MDDPRVETVRRTPLRSFLPFVLVPLAVLAGAGILGHLTSHQHPWRQKLEALRADAGTDTPLGESLLMSDVMVVRNDLLASMKRRQPRSLSPAQERLLTDCLQGPTDERSQSEALDALILAQRAGVLTPKQSQNALEECLTLLSRKPPYMVRLEGARFLSHSKSPKRIPSLRLLLNDPDPKIRAAAEQGLAQLNYTAPS